MEDTIAAAYVANGLETRKAVQEKLPSPTYQDHLDDAQEELVAIRLGSVEIEEYVHTYRIHTLRLRRLRTQLR